LLDGARMNHKLMIALCLGAVAATGEARADAVTDRVMLVPGGGGCGTNQASFRRILQHPDGRQTTETTEFTVPLGKYFEITSVEYTTPYWTQWAKFYVQSIDLNIRQRVGTAGTNVFSARYGNAATYTEDEAYNFINIDQYPSQGPVTRVASFPVGPLMSAAARLCLGGYTSNFTNYGGSIRVRGRLISSGDAIVVPPPDGGVLSP
jgi:hypothetical protein